MKLNRYDSRDAMFTSLADGLAAELRVALESGPATLVVPGGTTPGPVFDVLAQVDLNWSQVRVMLSDERFVPETSERSNTRLLRQRLLVGLAASAQLVPFYLPADAPEEVLDQLTPAIESALPITSLLLGMGDDMHTASLFPGADLLDQALSAQAPVLLPMRAPGAPEPRLTLTAPVLQGAQNTHIVITGAAKMDALEQAQKLDDPAQAPVCSILKNATVHWAE